MFGVRRYSVPGGSSLGLRLPGDLDDMLDRMAGLSAMPVIPRTSLRFRVIEHPNHYDVSVEAPGARKEDMKLQVLENTLTVEYVPAEKHTEKSEGTSPEGKVVLDERSKVRSRRVLTFTSELADTGHEAKMENGVLSVRLVKKAPAPQSVSRELAIS